MIAENDLIFIPKFEGEEINEPILGWHEARVLRYESKSAKESNKPYIQWVLELTDPAHRGRQFFTNFMLSRDGKKFLTWFLRTLDPSYIDGPISKNQFMGKKLRIHLTEQSYTNGPFSSYVWLTNFGKTLTAATQSVSSS